jgi:hypothetical protein
LSHGEGVVAVICRKALRIRSWVSSIRDAKGSSLTKLTDYGDPKPLFADR